MKCMEFLLKINEMVNKTSSKCRFVHHNANLQEICIFLSFLQDNIVLQIFSQCTWQCQYSQTGLPIKNTKGLQEKMILQSEVGSYFRLYQLIRGFNSMQPEQDFNTNTMFTSFTNQPEMTQIAYFDYQDSWMDQFFNQSVLEIKISIQPHISKIMEFQNTFSSLSVENECKVNSIEAQRRKNKSQFHNFQKHLLTLLKKVICIKKSQLIQLPFGNRAYDLWRIFLSFKSSSKKNLFIIFGIAQQQNLANLRKTAQNIPELQRLLNKHDLKQIQQGQELLRRVVCHQASLLEKIKMEAECKMKKFEQFYAYFLGFVEELSQGVISRRMTKQRKIRLTKIQQLKQ